MRRWHDELSGAERAEWKALGLEAAQKKLDRFGGETPERVHLAIAKWATEERRRTARVMRRTFWVSGATLVVSVTVAAITWLQWRESDSPKLVSTEAKLFVNPDAKPPELVTFNWNNMGKRSAVRGTASLFTVSDDGNRHEKLGQSEITAGGTSSTTLTPTFGYGTAQIPVDMHKFLGLFLACVKYHDEENSSYKQKFLFRLGTQLDKIVTRLDELPSKHQVCPTQP